MRNNSRKNGGITLIALVITIIVLLILAGVSIAALSGKNGILTKAKETNENTNESSEKELLRTAIISAQLEDESYSDLTYDNIKKAVYSQFGKNVVVSDNGDGSFIVSLKDREYQIQTNGNIEKLEWCKDTTPGELKGDGSENNPYLIESIEDLVAFAKSVNDGNTYNEQYIKLETNLNFNATSSYVNSTIENFCNYQGGLKDAILTQGFNSIGIDNNIEQNKYSFQGIFDGNGKNISNLHISINLENNESDIRKGLFGNNYGIIKNLGVTNISITSKLLTSGSNTNIMGGIVGYNYGVITNCFASGNITGEGENNAKCRVGGIAGCNSGEIKNCYNNCKITSIGGKLTLAGGIASDNDGKIENCYNMGEIKIIGTQGNGQMFVGGIYGYSNSNSYISNCYNAEKITSDGIGILYIGGVIGYSSVEMTIKNVCNVGKIDMNTENNYIGGIIGANYGKSMLNNAYYLSSVADQGVSNDNDDTIKIDNMDEMPTILSIIGSEFKKTNTIFPILNWQ